MREDLGKMNLSRKTLVDRRFLIWTNFEAKNIKIWVFFVFDTDISCKNDR
jgi:hypothetical protein